MSVAPEHVDPSTARAVVLNGPTRPDGLVPVEVGRPSGAAGEALVRVEAAAVNRSDVLNVVGLPLTTYPRTPGRDFAGTVVEGPARLVGAAVFGTGSGDLGFTRDGTHAQWLRVPADALVAVPDGFSAVEAGAAGLSYVTAATGLDRGGLRTGARVLVTGAAGGVGAAACAVARYHGAVVTAAVRDAAEQRVVQAAEPECPVIQTDRDDLAHAAAELSSGRGFDVVFDTVGLPLFEAALASVAVGGSLVVITAPPGAPVTVDLSWFYRRGASLVGINTTMRDSRWCASVLRDLRDGFDGGALPAPRIAEVFSLDDVAAAYGRVMTGAAGRVVIAPHL